MECSLTYLLDSHTVLRVHPGFPFGACGLFSPLRQAVHGHIAVVVGGIIPEKDIAPLKARGVRDIFLPGTTTGATVDAIRRLAGERA